MNNNNNNSKNMNKACMLNKPFNKENGNKLIIETEGMNKPSSWGLAMKAPWGSPTSSCEVGLAARLRQDVTMNEWGRTRRCRMRRKEGRRERQCLTLSPNSPRCYACRGKWLDCSGQNHWTTGCVRVSGRRDDNRNRQNRTNTQWGRLLKIINSGK